MTYQVIVEPYNPEWPRHFEELSGVVWAAVSEYALAIEHVGSTSVPGLAAKPIIDIDIVIEDMSRLPAMIAALATLGYEHRGNQGIVDREAFKRADAAIRHNLYVCPKDSIALRNHLCLRDALRADPALRDEYARLKQSLAVAFPTSIADYIDGKSDFILGILARHGFGPDNLQLIRSANSPK